jgi:hypothetical protein
VRDSEGVMTRLFFVDVACQGAPGSVGGP